MLKLVKRISIVAFIGLLLTSQVFSAPLANSNQNNPGSGYLAFAEKMPAPIGGIKSIYKQIKEYPPIAQKAGLQGKVYVLAYVDETGTCTKVDIVKGIGGGCDEAASEAVKKVKFTPAMHKGKVVKCKLSLAIVFKLG